MIELTKDNNGIAILTWDLPGTSANVLNSASVAAFGEKMEEALNDDSVIGMIVTSAKRDFILGGDLKEIYAMQDAEMVEKLAGQLHQIFRRLETGGKPVAAALNGSALGGGMELALACHFRCLLNSPKVQLGFPEVTLGLLPGAGGTQRLPRLVGIQNSLQPLLMGRKLRPDAALKSKWVNQLADTPEAVLQACKDWILSGPKAEQPWDKRGFEIPGGGVRDFNSTWTFAMAGGVVRQNTSGNYPAPEAILNCLYQGLQMQFDAAILVEIRYFVQLALSKVAKNMIRTLWFNMNDAKRGAARPEGVPATDIKKVGILGAGMMGAGIAYVSAKVGLEVVLKDVSKENAEKGKDYSRKLLEKQIEKGRTTREKADALLAKIHTTGDPADVAGCDLVVEAVFEDRGLKAKVTQESEAVLAENAVFASNTSTLPITGLAEASARPENFIGLHFFSPVDKMQLVEIIMGEKTSDAALAMSIDYIKMIRKVPIVVNDSRGFYTSRVFKTFVTEGMEMLLEGVKPALIENAAKMAGMPVGPLAVADEVSISLLHHIFAQNVKDGIDWDGRAREVVNLFVEKLDRPGKKAGKGFYEYPEGGRKRLWKGLAEQFPPAENQPDVELLKKRFLHLQALETYRILDEGVLRNPADGDIGSILAWGFPPYTGGTLSYIDFVGIVRFEKECRELAADYGSRYAPPASLTEKAAQNSPIFDTTKEFA